MPYAPLFRPSSGMILLARSVSVYLHRENSLHLESAHRRLVKVFLSICFQGIRSAGMDLSAAASYRPGNGITKSSRERPPPSSLARLMGTMAGRRCARSSPPNSQRPWNIQLETLMRKRLPTL